MTHKLKVLLPIWSNGHSSENQFLLMNIEGLHAFFIKEENIVSHKEVAQCLN